MRLVATPVADLFERIALVEQTKTQYVSKVRRPKVLNVRFSDDEYALVTDAAKRSNLSIGDWFRSEIMSALNDDNTGLFLTLIHEDMQFLKMFMGTLFLPYLTGKTLTKEQIANVLLELKIAKIAASKDEIFDAQNREEK